jgi:fatty-acyl-CoA synthase
MVIDMMNYCTENNMTIPTLTSILLGAANAPEHVVNQLYRVFPNLQTVIVAYGCTETSPVATYPAIDLPQSEMNTSVGTIVDFGSVKIVDPVTGKLVKHNEVGEIHLKGMLMSGYWDDAEKTAEVMRHGWYATGDLGVMDSRGLLRITGRTKELIIRGGANIYPKEVEDLLHKHENVLTVAVCGVPDQRLGEEVCAWIKLRDANINTTVDEIRGFCKDQISYYKIPKYVFFVDSFPMTASGKFQKFLMTDQSVQMINDLMTLKQTS